MADGNGLEGKTAGDVLMGLLRGMASAECSTGSFRIKTEDGGDLFVIAATGCDVPKWIAANAVMTEGEHCIEGNAKDLVGRG